MILYWLRLFLVFPTPSWRSEAIVKELYIAWNYIRHKYRYVGRYCTVKTPAERNASFSLGYPERNKLCKNCGQ